MWCCCCQVAGRLHIEISRLSGTLPDHLGDDVSSESSGDSRPSSYIDMEEDTGVAIGSNIVCRVSLTYTHSPLDLISVTLQKHYMFSPHQDVL